MFAAFGTGEEATEQAAVPEGPFTVQFNLYGGTGAGVDAGFGEEQGCRVAFGGMAPTSRRAARTEQSLIGQAWIQASASAASKFAIFP